MNRLPDANAIDDVGVGLERAGDLGAHEVKDVSVLLEHVDFVDGGDVLEAELLDSGLDLLGVVLGLGGARSGLSAGSAGLLGPLAEAGLHLCASSGGVHLGKRFERRGKSAKVHVVDYGARRASASGLASLLDGVGCVGVGVMHDMRWEALGGW